MNAVRRILVTNGAGFVGGWWVRHLRRQGHSVIVADAPLVRDAADVPGDVELVSSSLLDMEQVLELVDRVDTVFHLACDPPRLAGSFHEASWIGRALKAGLHVVEACAVLGRELVLVTQGDALGDAKAVESLALLWHCESGLSVKIARVFDLFGPKQSPAPGNIVAFFIAKALAGEALALPGDGSEKRSFVYIEDAVLALELVWRFGPPGSAFDIGSEEEVSMEELARAILALAGSSSAIVLEAGEDGESFQARGAEAPHSLSGFAGRCAQGGGSGGFEGAGSPWKSRFQIRSAFAKPDLAGLRSLGYEPRYDLENGLRKAVTHMKAEMRARGTARVRQTVGGRAV